MNRVLFVIAATIVLTAASGCREEGPAERAGRHVDEAVEKLQEGSEGTLERLGRDVDEAVEETAEAADEVGEAAKKAVR